MRKVTFKIDDQEYFRRELEKENCTEEQTENILSGKYHNNATKSLA